MSYENFAICAMLLRKGRARAPAEEIVSVEILSASFNRIGSSRTSGGDVRSGSETMFGPFRYILFPASFRLVLKSRLHAAPRNRYLFETRRFGPFTTRRIQQIVQGYREMAGITQPLHPHLFRHQMLTYLTSKGLTDAQIQLISGHESKKSLEVYQHLSLESVDKAYQDAVQSVRI